MNISQWYSLRGPKFVAERMSRLVNRYSLSPDKSTQRVLRCARALAEYQCAPTLPTPGSVVQKYPDFMRQLRDMGVEIAVHSYEHIDLSSVPMQKAVDQLEKAVEVFNRVGIEVHGFRCPYLRHSDELLESLPVGMFGYSSNKAVSLESVLEKPDGGANLIYGTVGRLYQARPADETFSAPITKPNFVEIPVCTPDDIQLHDGLNLYPEEIGRAWHKILRSIYQRGELFNLIFHPELIDCCFDPFKTLLQEARSLTPKVWIARLQDIADWWREKANDHVETVLSANHLLIKFVCSPRTVILARGFSVHDFDKKWDDRYYLLPNRVMNVAIFPRPFIGVDRSVPSRTVTFLRDQGYILEFGDQAVSCPLYLNKECLRGIKNDVDLVDMIESTDIPLIRFGRWPDGARSALSISGDMDALTLLDYFGRLAA